MLTKLRKLLIVVILTIAIWTYAYLAQEETVAENGTLNIHPRTSENLLVTFVDSPSMIPLEITLKGPAAKVSELQRNLHYSGEESDKLDLEFFYNVETEGLQKPGVYDINVLQFLRESTKIKKMALTVVNCEPEIVKIDVEELVEKWLTIQCLDENGSVVEHEIIEPSRVKMYVRQDWTGEMLTANIDLTDAQIDRARKSRIKVKPYVYLSAGRERRRFAPISVEVKLPSLESALKDRVLQPRIGYLVSKNIQGKYKIELLNEDVLTEATKFQATDEAWQRYEQTAHHLYIDVRDGDETVTGDITREIIYNFPQEFVRKKEIQLSQKKQIAVFRLTPVGAQAQP